MSSLHGTGINFGFATINITGVTQTNELFYSRVVFNSVATTYYLVAKANFTLGTSGVFGIPNGTASLEITRIA
jgi:hypothetical protein